MDNYILKYKNGCFVGNDGNGDYATNVLSKAVIFKSIDSITAYLNDVLKYYPNDGFEDKVYQINISPVNG